MTFDRPEDLYPLSPMQQGMLFQTLQLPASGVCFEQDHYTLRGHLDLPRFTEAWEQIVARHPVLRTTFLWEDLDEPHQIVHRRGVVDLQTQDWRGLSSDDQRARLDEYLATERCRGFDLTTLPLMRLGLFRMADEQHHLVWNFHHAILDGWSLATVMSELLALYECGRGGGPGPLAESRPYRDFIAWLQQQDMARAQAYWRRRLDGFTAKTPLTVDRRLAPDAAVTDDTFQRLQREVPASVTQILNGFSRRHRVTPSTLVLGAWALLLARYSGAEDVVLGSSGAGRPADLPGVDTMVGLFINTLPLRVSVVPGTTVLEWLKSIQDQMLDLREYEFSPLAEVQKWSPLPAGTSLFDSVVVFENYPIVAGATGGSLEIAYQPWTRHSKTGYPLTLLALPGERLLLEIKYDRRRFAPSTIDRMLGHVQMLLGGLARDPNGRIDELPLLQDAERAQLLSGVNRPATPSADSRLPRDGGATLHELFEAQAARCPDAVALTCEGTALTYAELNARANRLARELVELGVKPDTLVGLCVDRSSALVIGILAIVKAGGAYVPVDVTYPADRLAFIIDDAQAPVLLTESTLLASLPTTGAKVLCIDEVLARLPQIGSDVNLPAVAGPDHLAYVIYTSGTTGRPKGSLITHRNVVRLFAATEPWYGFTEREVWTLFHSPAFDFSVWELWGALLYGGRLVVVPFVVTRSPEAFYELLVNERVTVVNQTPSAFRQLIQVEESAGQGALALRYVIFGGEALEMQSLRPWIERHGDEKPRLINMYGITETTVHVTYRPLSRSDLDSGSAIGRPIPDLQVYILDRQRQPVPIGVPGEMYIGGAGLARGYLHRPELTAERFVPDHLTGRPGARLYRTGDLARFLPDGDIEYLGRIDHQVKIRGFRIELGEIESVLCEHPAVREAVVIARDAEPGLRRLVAYVVAPPPGPDMSELRQHLKNKLPDYMVPATFVFLEKLPLTGNGKIDRAALPAPDQLRPDLARGYTAPRTPAEETLAAIWAKVLRVDRVGIDDNFFELGGDSILSIQVISLARRAGLELTPQLLFANQTIAELAAAAGVAAGDASSRGELATGHVPLTPIQHWFFEQELAEPHHYNQAFLFEVARPLERALLERALAELSRHHDALRLRYLREAGGWRQFYANVEGAAPLTWVRLAGLTDVEQRRSVEAVAAATQASLRLEQGPLWRVAYFDLGSDRSGRLLVVVHHLAVDGISWRPLLEDLETAYQQLTQQEPVHLPAKTTSFKTWAERVQTYAGSDSLRSELAYWQGVSDPRSAADVLQSSLTGSAPSPNTEELSATLNVGLTADETRALLQRVPATYHTHINDVLLTALARAWTVCTGNRTLFTNLEGHGRESLFEHVDLSRTVGWFTSIFPVRLELPECDGTWHPGEALSAVKAQLRQIPQHGIGYGMLRYVTPDTELGRRRQPSMVFNYLGQFDQVLAGSTLFRFARESTGPWHSPRQRRRHELEVNSLVIDGRLEVSWTYGRAGHDELAIRQLADEFLGALRELIAHCLSRQEQLGTGVDVEDVYGLTPIQTLFYSANPGPMLSVFDQWHCTLHGDLDVSAFQTAWQETLRRHPILRSTVHAHGLPEPQQVVHHAVRPRWRLEDWRAFPADGQSRRWSALLNDDRAQPLNLTEAPAMRLALIRLADDRWKFLWSLPALLLDGWSWPLVFGDVSRLYDAAVRGHEPGLAPARPYRAYLEWLGRQSHREAREFWRQSLAGVREPTPLPSEAPDPDATGPRHIELPVQLSAETTTALQAAARSLQVTLNTLVQGAWAVLLAGRNAAAEIVFGAAFAGRPPDLQGVESIVGPFVNNVPVRVTLSSQTVVADFLRQLHAHLLELNPYQFVPLTEIADCSEVPAGQRLFHSLVVFQNYLVDDSARRLGTLEISDFTGPVHSNYPALLLAEPGRALRLTLICDRQAVAAEAVRRWGRDLAVLMEHLPVALGRRLAELQALVSPPRLATARVSPTLRVAAASPVPPQTEMEETIAGVWQELVGAQAVSVEDNFFDVGAHSLFLVQLHRRLQETLGREFPVVALFEHPSIRSLARHLAQPAWRPGQGDGRFRDRAQRHQQALAEIRTRLKKD